MSKILIFGENPNDTRALKALVLGLCPALRANDVRTLRDPPTLQRDAKAASVRRWVDKATATLRAASVSLGQAVCVIVHCDADKQDDGSVERSRTAELRAAGFARAHAVVPIESIEAWWLLFPDATESVVPTWRGAITRAARDTDSVAKPKEQLIDVTSRKQPKRPYRESDSERIAAAIAADPLLRTPRGSSGSFMRFVRTVDECCVRALRP